MNKQKLILVSVCLFLASCNRKEDALANVPQTSATIQNPVAPTCSTVSFSGDGGVSSLSTMAIPLHHVPDTISFSFKKWNASNWVTFRPDYYSDVVFSVSGATITITNNNVYQCDWAYAGTYKDCH